MTPNFVGVGIPRGGTTWLHQLLESHPDAAVPFLRKEIHFFDHHYKKGLAWYEGLFPPDKEAGHFIAVGEITPHYLYDPEVPARIKSVGSIRRIIVMLRDPAKRAFSDYQLHRLVDCYKGEFRQFLEDYPDALKWGYYADGLERFYEHFDRSQVLIVIHERDFKDPIALRVRVAEHLGLDPDRFSEGAGESRINQATIPRFHKLYSISIHAYSWLHGHNYATIPSFLIRRLGLKQLLFGGRRPQDVKLLDEDLHYLREYYSEEIMRLEKLLDTDLSVWRK